MLAKWNQDILDLRDFKVIKFERVFQVVFYLLGYTREEICYEGTNQLWWKKAKQLIGDEFFERMKAYDPIGPKPSSFKKYQVINWLRDFLEEVTQEDVDAYSLAVGKLFRWADLALQVRHENVLKRTLTNMQLKKELAEAEQLEADRLDE